MGLVTSTPSHRYRKVTLVPFTPKQVHDDQLSLQREFEMERERRKLVTKAEDNESKDRKGNSVEIGKLGKKLNFLVKLKVVR